MLMLGQAADEVDIRGRSAAGDTLLLLLNAGWRTHSYTLPRMELPGPVGGGPEHRPPGTLVPPDTKRGRQPDFALMSAPAPQRTPQGMTRGIPPPGHCCFSFRPADRSTASTNSGAEVIGRPKVSGRPARTCRSWANCPRAWSMRPPPVRRQLPMGSFQRWCRVAVVGPDGTEAACCDLEGKGSPGLGTVDQVAYLALWRDVLRGISPLVRSRRPCGSSWSLAAYISRWRGRPNSGKRRSGSNRARKNSIWAILPSESSSTWIAQGE